MSWPQGYPSSETNIEKLPKVPGGPAPGAKVNPAVERHKPQHVFLPVKPFLYTLDQISHLTSIPLPDLRQRYVFFEGRSTYVKKKGQMTARNIAEAEETPNWRILETELIRWMKVKGFKYYATGVFYESERDMDYD